MTNKTNLLIIDDDPGACETLSDIFEDEGYHVATANTCRQAEDKLEQTAFDAALIDIKLPDMDGIVLLREFKKSYPEMICIIITGYAALQNAIEALKQGADGYFTKPLVIEEIIHRVEESLDKKRLQRELRESEEAIKLAYAELDQIFNTAADGMCVVDKDFNILRANETFSTLAGIGKDEAAGKKCYEVFPCHLYHTAGCALTRILGGEERVECEAEKERKDGARISCIMTATPFRGSGGELIGIVESFKDITKRKQAQEALRESEKRYMALSITDSLTGLYNSRHFYNQLKSEIERAIRYKRSLSLLLLDVDNFKHYNDNYGHLEGDKVLVRLGEVIRGCIRKADSAYRYGGEEFTVMLPETESKETIDIAERIRKRFETETFSPTPEDTVHVTVSIGTAQYQPDEKLSVFVNRADEAMYEAKKQGKNRVFFSQSNRRLKIKD